MNEKTINGIREYYSLPDDVADEQIAKDLKGSFGEACVNIGLAKKDLEKAFREAMPKVFNKYFKE